MARGLIVIFSRTSLRPAANNRESVAGRGGACSGAPREVAMRRQISVIAVGTFLVLALAAAPVLARGGGGGGGRGGGGGGGGGFRGGGGGGGGFRGGGGFSGGGMRMPSGGGGMRMPSGGSMRMPS